MLVVIHNKPPARQSQPIGFSGRLEAIRAPTSGKTKKSPEASRPPVVRSPSQLLGTWAERASTNSGTLATNKATDKPHNDHASQESTRVLNSPALRSRSLRDVLSVTTPLYKMARSFSSKRPNSRAISKTSRWSWITSSRPTALGSGPPFSESERVRRYGRRGLFFCGHGDRGRCSPRSLYLQ